MTDLDQKVRELRALAGKATPGEWERGEQPVHYPGMVRPAVNIYGDRLIASAEYWEDEDGHDNAAYMAAANPATLTAILDEFDRRGAALVEAEGALERVRNTTHHATGFSDLSARRAAFKVADEALSRVAVSHGEGDAVAWLIERKTLTRSGFHFAAPMWWRCEYGWTHDASLALRFARREDAEVFRQSLCLVPNEIAFVSEHVWHEKAETSIEVAAKGKPHD